MLPIKNKTRKIVLIGSGNVATHLGKMIANSRAFAVIQVYSKTLTHARSLGNKLNIPWTHHLNDINIHADIYIIAVRDDMISSVAASLAGLISKKALVVHTSGSTSSKVLKAFFKDFGALYPLQTFSKEKKNISHSIPFFITASGTRSSVILRQFAFAMSDQVKVVTDETRAIIHLSAVLVNNFPNYFYFMAERILKSKKIEFKVVLPLIEETTAKLKALQPMDAQTGPARRRDIHTINLHKGLLKKHFPMWSSIYRDMSNLILTEYKRIN
jgi:predicted short-subunit dehydrogenase-like oxidoreductase (DUF2520 family)